MILPGHDRAHHTGCPYCEARARGEAHDGIDPPAQHEAVYITPDRLYGKFYASQYGYGDLYRVDPVGAVTKSDEDTWLAYRCAQARIVAVLDRAVLLTPSERRRVHREWTDNDMRRDPSRATQILIEAQAEKRNIAAAHARIKTRLR